MRPPSSSRPSGRPARVIPARNPKTAHVLCRKNGVSSPTRTEPPGRIGRIVTTDQSVNLTWLLDDLVSRVPSAQQAVVLSADGLMMGASTGLPRDDAEHLSAMAAGFQSLAKGASRH